MPTRGHSYCSTTLPHRVRIHHRQNSVLCLRLTQFCERVELAEGRNEVLLRRRLESLPNPDLPTQWCSRRTA